MTRATSFAGGRGRGRGAFTVIELLVVVAIVLILAGITTHSLRAAMIRARVAQARAEIVQISGALETYFRIHGAHPPDTGDWNEATSDPRSIHRHLARDLVDPDTGRRVGACMGIPSDRLTKPDATGARVYMDPWGNAYHLDARHMTRVAGKWQRIGEPYLPSRTEAERVKTYKVLSFGPDGVSDPAYPFDWATLHPDAKDDVRSW